MKKNIKIFLLFFIFSSIIFYFHVIDLNEIWSYGFTYNISRGLIPYKEFNMVVSPLYNLLFAIPLKIFGNYLLVYELSHAFLYSFIFTLAYQRLGKKSFLLPIAVAIQSSPCWYNTFIAVLTLFILIILDSNSKYKNLIIGLTIGIIAMTKHNVGLPLLLVYFITSKEKTKSLLYFFIPVLISFIYLYINKAVYNYIDICFLGIGNFMNNLMSYKVVLLITIALLIYLVKKYLDTKDNKLLYILAFSTITFPLFEPIHFSFIIVPLSYYILLKEKNEIVYKSLYIFIIFAVIANLISIDYLNTKIIKKNNSFKYLRIEKNTINYMEKYTNYINNIEGNVYLFIGSAYLIRIYNNQTPSFTDLINEGNLGSNNKKYLDEIDKKCKNEKCSFIVDEILFKKRVKGVQLLESYRDYVVNNYKFVEVMPSKDRLYRNY